MLFLYSKYSVVYLCHNIPYKYERMIYMKKKLLSVLLTAVLVLTSAVPAFAANEAENANAFNNFAARTIDRIMTGFSYIVNGALKEGDNFVKEENFVLDNFYEGTKEILDKPAENAVWSLGYDASTLVPEDYLERGLFLGGFMTIENGFVNKITGNHDDMKVRTIALSDGSGRGISVFATIDSIGMTNADIRDIRGLLSEFAEENGINSLNIFTTHSHSGIDTQGLWTNNLKNIPKNLFSSLTRIGKVGGGTDKEYMSFLASQVKASVENAVKGMKEGKMTFAQKDIGEEYFQNKNRQSSSTLMTDLTRFMFTPFDGSTPTIIANMAAHPDVVGLPILGDEEAGHYISGDYVYYIGETLNEAGYNFMFFNGAICGIYIGRDPSGDGVETEKRVEIVERYGREIGRMLLALTMTEDEIKADPYLSVTGDTEEEMAGEDYTLWYKDWKPTEETEVEPLLNVKLKSVRLPVTNNIIKLAAKLKLINHTVIKEGKQDYISTEIGVLDIGSHKVVLMPGEVCQDLIRGGASLTAEGSVWGKAYEGKTVAALFGEDVIVFGLANDAIGYIVPDNDYALGLDFGHYHETLSLGKNTASLLIAEYETLA